MVDPPNYDTNKGFVTSALYQNIDVITILLYPYAAFSHIVVQGAVKMTLPYDRGKAVAYAHKWAFLRNPAYYNFDELGGDCTNFASQCLYAGCGMMNYTKDTGWYYASLNNRAAAWSGVEFLHKFLTANKGNGPYASEQPEAQEGDIVQLSFDGKEFTHSLFVVSVHSETLVASHTFDCDNRPLSTYTYKKARVLHIEGARG